MTSTQPTTISAYIASFPKEIQEILEQIRAIVKNAAPEAVEAIKYGMPTFTLKGNLVHFAAFKNHIGLYPTPSGTEAFKEELAGYKSGKGSIQFQLEEPIPWDLITRIVEFRVQESAAKTKKLTAKTAKSAKG